MDSSRFTQTACTTELRGEVQDVEKIHEYC